MKGYEKLDGKLQTGLAAPLTLGKPGLPMCFIIFFCDARGGDSAKAVM